MTLARNRSVGQPWATRKIPTISRIESKMAQTISVRSTSKLLLALRILNFAVLGSGLPSALMDWLRRKVDKPNPLMPLDRLRKTYSTFDHRTGLSPGLKIVLGPGGSYVAWNRAFVTWKDVPRGLEIWLKRESDIETYKWKVRPARIITFGCHGAYFALQESNGSAKNSSYCWNAPVDFTHLANAVKYFFSKPSFDIRDLAVSG